MAFIKLANLIDLHDGYKQAVSVAGRKLLLIQDEGDVYVVENRCPHMDAPLTNGAVAAKAIRCPVHGIEFELDSGRSKGPLADTLDCLVRFTPVYQDQYIGVDL